MEFIIIMIDFIEFDKYDIKLKSMISYYSILYYTKLYQIKLHHN